MVRFWLKRANAPSVITLADRARDGKQWELAASLYRDALSRKPANPPIWVQYGHVLKEAGNLLDAETAYRRALAYNPNDADAHLQLGHVLKMQDKHTDAEAAYFRALELDPSFADRISLNAYGVDSEPDGAASAARALIAARTKEYFDDQFYLRVNSDVRKSGMDPLQHFVEFGARENRDPSTAFKTDVYTKFYPNSASHRDGPFFSFLELPSQERAARLRQISEWRGPTKPLPPFERYPIANGIFLVVHEALPTGAPLIALNLLRALVQNYRLPVVTILLDSAGPLKSDFKMHSIEVIEYDSLQQQFQQNLKDTWDEIARRLTRHRIGAGVCNTILAGDVIPKLAARGLRCLSLVHELSDSIKGFGWDRYAEAIAAQASVVVFPGMTVRDDFVRSFGRPRGISRIISQPPNIPVDDGPNENVASTRKRVRRELGIDPDDILVLSVGTGDLRKGIDLYVRTVKAVLDAAASCAKRIRFVWVGDVPPQHQIWAKKDLREWNYEAEVIFAGAQRNNVNAYFLLRKCSFYPPERIRFRVL